MPGAGKRQGGRNATASLTSARPADRAPLRDTFRRPCPRYAPARYALPAQPGLEPLPAARAGVIGDVSALYAGLYAAVGNALYEAIAGLLLRIGSAIEIG